MSQSTVGRRILNDFAAAALGIPHLDAGDRSLVGGGAAQRGKPIGVIGPGTGLGVASLFEVGGAWVVGPGEGGHVTMSPNDAEESRILDFLREKFGHVSAERVLSGQGLENLYEAVTAEQGTPRYLPAPEITKRTGTDPDCVRVMDLFCAMLGTVAGNLALTVGAAGGVFIAGGIAPKCAAFLLRSRFRARFEAKGRLSSYMRGIPTFLVTHSNPALLGLAHLGRQARAA